MITRINEFQAREGEADRLRELLTAVVTQLRSTAGCISCRLLQGLDDTTRIVILEEWESVEAHRAALANTPPSEFEPVKKLLAGPPTGTYFTG